MKKPLARRLWSSLFATLLLGTTYAQLDKTIAQASLPPATREAEAVPATPGIAVNAKIQGAFGRAFRDAQDPYWNAIAYKKGGAPSKYSAYFKTGGRKALAVYSRKGVCQYTILYGSARHLPDQYRRQLQKIYRGYEITYAHEIAVAAEKLWIVSLENRSEFIKTRIWNGEVDELERYKRF